MITRHNENLEIPAYFGIFWRLSKDFALSFFSLQKIMVLLRIVRVYTGIDLP